MFNRVLISILRWKIEILYLVMINHIELLKFNKPSKENSDLLVVITKFYVPVIVENLIY